jgi:hypothetical protein
MGTCMVLKTAFLNDKVLKGQYTIKLLKSRIAEMFYIFPVPWF